MDMNTGEKIIRAHYLYSDGVHHDKEVGSVEIEGWNGKSRKRTLLLHVDERMSFIQK